MEEKYRRRGRPPAGAPSPTVLMREVMLENPALPDQLVAELALLRMPPDSRQAFAPTLVSQTRRTLGRALMREAASLGLDLERLVEFLEFARAAPARDVAAMLRANRRPAP